MTNGKLYKALADMLAEASGTDQEIDKLLARAFDMELAEFTSSAETARSLVAQVVPQATLRVGYDVRGILPSATINLGKLGETAVAPTVPLAILQSLVAVLLRSMRERPEPD